MPQIKPEIENIQKILKQNEKEKEQFDFELKKTQKTIEENESVLKEKEKKALEFRTKFRSLLEKRTKLGEEINEIERKIDEMNDKNRGIEIKQNMVSLERAKLAAEMAGLEQEFSQYPGVQILKEKDEGLIKAEIEKFERMVIQMGNVNLKALEIYEEVEKEYNALLEKKEKFVGKYLIILSDSLSLQTFPKESQNGVLKFFPKQHHRF